MTAFLRRATSGLRMWLGWDSATFRGFGLGRPGTGWPTWSLLAPVTSAPPRLVARRTADPLAFDRVCGR
jgi:hypothetical protein